MQTKTNSAIDDNIYSLYLRYPDGAEFRYTNITIFFIRRGRVLRRPEHGYRPVFVQVTPEPSEELKDYVGLDCAVHPTKSEGFQWGGALL